MAKYLQASDKDYLRSDNKLDQQLAAEMFKHNICEEIVELIENDSRFNRILGLLYGCFIGDSLGSYCQFQSKITQATIQQVMCMPGKGTFNIDPGQLTDDSELALSLCDALLTYKTNKPFESQIDSLVRQAANNYIAWMNSNPFDIGNTCSSAFKALTKINPKVDDYDFVSEACSVTMITQNSQSNGSMMRIAPMAIFSSLLQNYTLKDLLILKQIRLTHSSPAVLECSLSWVHLLQSLINRQSDMWLIAIFNQFMTEYSNQKKYPNISEWLKQLNMKVPQQGGWTKTALIWGLQNLKRLGTGQIQINQKTYELIISDVIMKGGDTDTNACIVGGLVGCIVGFKRLPPGKIIKMLNLNLAKGKASMPRPEIYHPRRGFNFAYSLYRLFKKA